MTEEEEAREAVARGASWLESRFGPGWRSRIRRPVEITSSGNCPLAQVNGTSYADAVGAHELGDMELHRLGFSVWRPGPFEVWPEGYQVRYHRLWQCLQVAWEEVIAS